MQHLNPPSLYCNTSIKWWRLFGLKVWGLILFCTILSVEAFAQIPENENSTEAKPIERVFVYRKEGKKFVWETNDFIALRLKDDNRKFSGYISYIDSTYLSVQIVGEGDVVIPLKEIAQLYPEYEVSGGKRLLPLLSNALMLAGAGYFLLSSFSIFNEGVDPAIRDNTIITSAAITGAGLLLLPFAQPEKFKVTDIYRVNTYPTEPYHWIGNKNKNTRKPKLKFGE